MSNTPDTPFITREREAKQINSIALTLGIEQPFKKPYEKVEFLNGHIDPAPVRDERLWRNWLDAVERVCEQHGRIPLQETGQQLSLDLGDA